MDTLMFERLNDVRRTCANALETHWALLEEQVGSVDAKDAGLDDGWLEEHERLTSEAANAEAALLAAIRWSGPPPSDRD